MADGEVKEKAKTLIRIGQKMDNQKDPSLKIKEAMLPRTIEGNRNVSDMVKMAILKETTWQKIFTCTMKRKLMKILI